MALLPDFGTYLIDNQINKPFNLRVCSNLMLGQDGILGWVVSGSTTQCLISRVDSNPIPHVTKPYLFSIYLGRGSQSRAEKILSRLKTEGLSVVPREDKRYLVPNGQEHVIPLQYLKP